MFSIFLPSSADQNLKTIASETIAPNDVEVPRDCGFIGTNFKNHAIHEMSRLTPGIYLRINRPQVRKRISTIVIRWSTNPNQGEQGFGGRIKVATHPSTPGHVVSADISKNIIRVKDHELSCQLDLLRLALPLIADSQLLEQTDVMSQDAAKYSEMNVPFEQIKEVIHIAREQYEKDNQQRAAADKRAQEFMSTLPDNTPLMVRTAERRMWQIGVKNGRMPIELARNSKILPSEFLRGKEAAAAGLSMHSILHLDAAAKAALASHPKAAFFQVGSPSLPSRAIIHKGQPFHRSYLSAKKKPIPAAWLQTRSGPYNNLRLEIIGQEPAWRVGSYGAFKFKAPYFKGAPARIVIQDKSGNLEDSSQIHPFTRIAGLWVVAPQVQVILAQMNISDIHLSPFTLLKSDGATCTQNWRYICADTPKSAVIAELCDPDIINLNGGRTVQPFEVVVDQDKIAGSDIWWDENTRSGALFLSDRLYKALKKAKACPAVGLKPCVAG